MLPAKAIAFFAFFWIVGMLLGSFLDMTYLGVDQTLSINNILFYDVASVQGTYGSMQLATGPLDYVGALLRKATFQFSFFTAESALIKWLAFGGLTAYFTFGMIMTVVSIMRGTI